MTLPHSTADQQHSKRTGGSSQDRARGRVGAAPPHRLQKQPKQAGKKTPASPLLGILETWPFKKEKK